MSKIYFILLLHLIVFSGSSQRIHIIGLIDYQSDERVYGNKYIKNQLIDLKNTFENTDYEVDTIFFLKEELADTNFVISKIKNLQVTPNDAIFCYVAAHGYNKNNELYPTVRLGTTNQSDIYIGNLKQLLNQKQVRLYVLLNESCNVLYKTHQVFSRNAPRANLNKKTIKALFNDSKGSFIMMSCNVSQRSIITDEGGIFSQCFFNALNEQFYSELPHWEVIAQKTAQLTPKKVMENDTSFIQNPIYENNIQYAESHNTQEEIEKQIVIDVSTNTYRVDDFEIEIKTDKGRNDVVYYKSDTIRYWFKTTKPCFLRLIDIWPDNRICLLLDNYEVKPEEVSKWVEIKIAKGKSIICVAPFGIDYLMSFASTQPFCKLNLLMFRGTKFVKGDLKDVLNCSRNSLNSIVLEDKLLITTKDRLSLTKPK